MRKKALFPNFPLHHQTRTRNQPSSSSHSPSSYVLLPALNGPGLFGYHPLEHEKAMSISISSSAKALLSPHPALPSHIHINHHHEPPCLHSRINEMKISSFPLCKQDLKLPFTPFRLGSSNRAERKKGKKLDSDRSPLFSSSRPMDHMYLFFFFFLERWKQRPKKLCGVFRQEFRK